MDRRLAALAEASARIFGAQSSQDTLRLITEAARDLVGAHQSVTSLTLGTDWSQAIVSVSMSEKYAAWRDFDAKPTGKGIYAVVCRTNKPMRFTQAELEAHPAWQNFGAARAKHPPMRGWLAVPLTARDGTNLGLIQLSDKYEGDFDADDETLMVQLARQGALAIENLRLIEKAKADELRFQEFAEIASDWLWETDADHRFTFFGGTSGTLDNRPYGSTRWEVAKADVAEPLWQGHMADLAARRPFRNFEYGTYDSAGRRRHISVSGNPVFAAGDVFRGYRGTATDLTDRREAEAKALEVADQYRRIVETTNEGVWIVDADARTVFANRRMGEMLGYAAEELLGRSVYEFRPPEDRVERENRWSQRQQGVAEHREARFLRRDGTVFWAQISAQPLTDADGKFAGSLGMVSDITARKEAEAALKASEERYRLIVETANEGIVALDAGDRITFANARMAAMLGRTVGELVGHSLFEFKPKEEIATSRRRLIERAAGTRAQFEASFLRADGTVFWTLINAEPLRDANGGYMGSLGMVADITGRKRAEALLRTSEERFRDFAETGSDWRWESDAEHHIVFHEGPTSNARDFALGKRRWEYGGVDAARPEWRRHISDLALRVPFRNFEYAVRDREDAIRFFSISGKPVFDSTGTFVGYRGTTSEITARHEAEAKARSSERRFKDFAAVASDWMWETDTQHRFSYFSPSRELSQNDPSSAALGMTRWDYAGVDANDPIWRAHLADLEARRPFHHFEYQYRRPDGTTGVSTINGMPVFTEEGEFAGYRGTATDITAQRAAEAAARETAEQFRRVVETANEGLWITDNDARILFANNRVTEMFGYQPGELIGRSIFDTVPPDRFEEVRRHRLERTQNKVGRHEGRHLRKDGSQIAVLISSAPRVDAAGAVSGSITMFIDITDRKRAEAAAAASEQRFKDFAEIASDWLWETDAEHRLTMISGKGLPIDNQPFGRTRWDLAGASADDPAWRDHIANLDAHLPFRDFEFTVKGDSGRTHYLDASGRPSFDEAGRFTGYRGTTTNRTRQHEAEAAAQESEGKFRRFVETANEGVWMVDPDFRTTYINQRTAEMLGYTESEILDRPYIEFKFPEDRELAMRNWEHTRGNAISRAETRLRRKDGSALWVMLSTSPQIENGVFIGDFGMMVDITARKTAEEAAARAKREVDAVLASISDGFIAVDNEWRFTYINPAAERIVGRSSAEMIGRPALDALKLDPGNVFNTCYLGAKRDGQSISFAAFSDLFGMWIESRVYPHAEGLTIFFRDVTAERAAHLALADGERKLRAALENNQSILASVSDGFVALDNDWRFTFINAAAERMWGIESRQWIGKSLGESIGVDDSNSFHQNYLESKKTGEPVTFTGYSALSSNWLEVRGYPHAAGYTIFFDDVTEERASQLALIESRRKLEAARVMNERIFETSLDLICITDRQGNFVQVNPGTSNQFGFPMNELIGHNASEFIHADDLAATRAAMRESRRSNRLHTFENRCLRKDGAAVQMNWSVAWSEAEQKYFMIGRDITERIEAQERTNRSQRLEALGQLTGGIAHDFNNLLTVIMGNSDMLAQALKDSAPMRRLAEMSLEASRRAAELTAQLLAFARRQTLTPKVVDPNTLVLDMLELVKRTLGAQIEIDLALVPEPWRCKVDATQLETALINLAVNARDAMSEGGQLTIATVNRTVAPGGAGDLLPGDYAVIEVADTGEGMAPDVLARAFEPFFTTKDVGKGSGLGLAMVYGFVKQSEGHVAIESAPGQGTRVSLYLPRAAEEMAPEAPRVPEASPLPRGTESILVVEDDPGVREMVTAQLGRLGYRVVVAGNGATARNLLFGGEKVDLLFTDIMMPGGVSGPQLAAEARRRLPGLKILFTSGYADMPTLESAPAEAELLRKPYTMRDLARTIRKAFDQPADVPVAEIAGGARRTDPAVPAAAS